MWWIFFFVGMAFLGYLYTYETGKLKEKKKHIAFALMAFACEFNAILLMNARLKEVYQLGKELNKDVLFHHIVFSCIFLLVASIIALSGFAIMVKDWEVSRTIHKSLVWWFFLTWGIATLTGLIILY